MKQGLVLKNQNGYFSVITDEGRLYTCRSRGRLKRKSSVLVGDAVTLDPINEKEAVLLSVLPRKTELFRPPAANIDELVLTVSAASPTLDLSLLDRMIVLAEEAGTTPVICLSKADLDEERALRAAALYKEAGYPVAVTSMVKEEGLLQLTSLLTGRIIAFSGPSGVGKSSLINALLGRSHFETQSVSAAIGRGRNTTRHAELVHFAKHSYLMDTPGYTALSLEHLTPEGLDYDFREFRSFLGTCRFADCRHISEPSCAVRKAVEDGIIAASRYRSYCELYKEIMEQERHKY